jgi:alanyl-tRNA synthetase
MALFGEKYGEIVRMVSVGDGWSRELCGGTHVRNVAEIGCFKIISESGIGGGIRRVECVTGRQALRYFTEQEAKQVGLIEDLQAKVKELEKELSRLQAKIAQSEAASLVEKAVEVGGVKVIAAVVSVASMDDLRNMTDSLRDKIGSGAVVLGAVAGPDKVNLVAAVTKDLAGKRLHAGNIVKALAGICGGGGGGRPDLATAGGKLPEKLGEAIGAVRGLVESQLG